MNKDMFGLTTGAENTIKNIIASINLTDPLRVMLFIVDILAVIFVIYYIAKLLKDTRAKQIVKGIAIFILATLVSEWLQLVILNYILKAITTYGVLLIIVVFQPELRKGLEKIGRSKFFSSFVESGNVSSKYVINEIVKAVDYLSKEGTGALIVIERDIKLEDIIREGVELNAKVSSELLINIFVPNTPLHDGAVIVDDNKIRAASCVLPLASEEVYDKKIGTRHRAAIGITEVSDAITIVVSEETSQISIMVDGKIQKGINIQELKQKLMSKLIRPVRK